MTHALVLGGGGTMGLAWETGLLAGLAETGIDIRHADLFVGTSAGATVAAQLTSGVLLHSQIRLLHELGGNLAQYSGPQTA